MIKKLFEYKYLILLYILLIASFILTVSYHGNIIVDNGREAYYPTQILAGKILYKDIFDIYGPFAYQFNAVLFKIFGIHLNVLYAAGCLCAFFITNLVFNISRKFMPESTAFALSALTIFIGTFGLTLFNFVFPYSFGILYGLVFVLTSLYFLLEYSQGGKVKYLYLACLFSGFAFVSKYDFLLYIFAIAYVAFLDRKVSIKEFFFGAAAIAAAPILCFGTLALQGLSINDFYTHFFLIHKMMQTDTLKYFYLHKGIYPSLAVLRFSLFNFIKTIIPIIFLAIAIRLDKPIIKWSLFILGFGLEIFLVDGNSFIFLPILLLIWLVLDFRKIKQNKQLVLLILASLLISAKSFWALISYIYGAFYLPIILLAAIALIFDKFKNKYLSKIVSIYLLIFSLMFIGNGLVLKQIKTTPIETKRGKIYSTEDLGDSSAKLLNFIKNKTKPSDKVVIYPEGLLFNFLTERESDNYYSSLIPLNFETFGENHIIEHLKLTKPDYIIFNNYDMSDYYYKHFCEDYAQELCAFVVKNYTHIDLIKGEISYQIFKRKE